MRIGRTYTEHFRIETRQHELLGLDLGEGVPRRALVLGVTAILLWVGLMILLLGAPSKASFSLYMLPPIFFTAAAMQQSTRVQSRRRITEWALRVHYVTRGHRPLLRLGALRATRNEYLPLRTRVGHDTYEAVVRLLTPWRPIPDPHEAHHEVEDDLSERHSRPINLNQTPRLIDQAHVQKAWERTFRRRTSAQTGESA